LVTGIDLIGAQLRIAAGEALWIKQRDVRNQGHAIECRINAENPAKGFMPSPGRLVAFVPPGGPGVRVDSHCYSGYSIPPHYDSMIAKLIVHRRTRDEAIRCMIRALDEFVVEGPYTTISFLREVLSHADFLAGLHDTNFVERTFGSTP
jgi:acetyl-CoA carboxylase biotin carboxylase subunit